MDWNVLSALAEIVAAVAVIVSLLYLARQVAMSNRLARAEATRTPISDLNSLNAAFGTQRRFNSAIRRVFEGADPRDFEPDDRMMLDAYWASLANMYEQLYREVSQDILDEGALDFPGRGLFETPYVRSSWALYRPYFGSAFIRFFEQRYDFEGGHDTVL